MALVRHPLTTNGAGGTVVVMYDDITLDVDEIRFVDAARGATITMNAETVECTRGATERGFPVPSGRGLKMRSDTHEDARDPGRSETIISFDGELKVEWPVA